MQLSVALAWKHHLHFLSAASSLKCSKKLQISIKVTSFCGIFFLILDQLHLYKTAAILGSTCFGISVSVIFPLLLSIPAEFNLKFRADQLSNVLISPLLASMFLTGVTGRLMEVNISMLFYALIIIIACFWTNLCFLFGKM